MPEGAELVTDPEMLVGQGHDGDCRLGLEAGLAATEDEAG